MELQPKLLRNKISELEKDLEILKQNLKSAEDACEHKFSEVKYDPYYVSDYTNSLHGISSSGSQFHTKTMKSLDRWKRECLSCGKVEYTQEFTTKTEKIPTFGDDENKKGVIDAINEKYLS